MSPFLMRYYKRVGIDMTLIEFLKKHSGSSYDMEELAYLDEDGRHVGAEGLKQT